MLDTVGIDTSIFTRHSTRAAAASKAKEKDIPLALKFCNLAMSNNQNTVEQDRYIPRLGTSYGLRLDFSRFNSA